MSDHTGLCTGLRLPGHVASTEFPHTPSGSTWFFARSCTGFEAVENRGLALWWTDVITCHHHHEARHPPWRVVPRHLPHQHFIANYLVFPDISAGSLVPGAAQPGRARLALGFIGRTRFHGRTGARAVPVSSGGDRRGRLLAPTTVIGSRYASLTAAWANWTNSAISGVRRVATHASRTSLGGMSVIGVQATSDRW